MKKATKTTNPINLGTKRHCPTCGIKFYDFGKPEVSCPKCEAKVEAMGQDNLCSAPVVAKRHIKSDKSPVSHKSTSEDSLIDNEDILSDDSEPFETLEGLDDEEEDVLDDLESENDEEKEKY